MYLSFQDLEDAYYRARRGKSKKPDIIAREECLEQNMKSLYHDLCTEKFTISLTKRVIVQDPVVREIIVLSFRDRIVQHLIYGYLAPLREPTFIYDSYSNRKGKGTLFGIRRVSQFMRGASDNFRQDAYVMKLDIQSYFLSVDRQILRELIIQKVWFVDTLWDKAGVMGLVRQFIFHDYIAGCDDRTSHAQRSLLPAHKSLFSVPVTQGMPLGNLTSQLFANIYLHQLDCFIKHTHTLKIRYYGRYVDDFILIHPSKGYLISCLSQIRDFLFSRLSLTLHPHKIYLQSIHKGVKFLGVMIYPYYRVLAKRTIGRAFRKIQDSNDKDRIYQSWMSYRGLAMHHDCRIIRKQWREIYIERMAG